MSLEQRLKLYLDISKYGSTPLLTFGDTSTSDRTQAPVLIEGDCLTLRLCFVNREDNDRVVVALDEGSVIIVGGKKDDDLEDGDLLFSATGFEAVVEGEGVSAETGYEATLNLNTEELLAAFEGRAEIIVKFDVEVENTGNTLRNTLQFDVKVRQEAYAGEIAPLVAEPDGYTAAQSDALFLKHTEADANRWIVDGTSYLYNPDTGLWHAERAKVVDGVVVHALDQVGVSLEAIPDVDPDPTGYTTEEADATFVKKVEPDANRQFANHTWYLLDPDTGLWHAERAKVVDGVVVIVLEQTGVTL